MRPHGRRAAIESVPAMAGAAAPRKAASVHLTRNVAPPAAFRVIARACLTHISANIASARHDRDPEAVHQIRVGLRRLRAAVSSFRDVLPVAWSSRLGRELRWLQGRLAAAREWDVFIGDLLATDRSRHPANDQLTAIAALAERQRTKAYARCCAALDGRRCARLLDELSARLAAPATFDAAARRSALPRFAATALRRRHKQLHRLGKRLGKLDAAELHALRIRGKRLRYALEFFADLFPAKPARVYIAALRALQDVMGRIQDGYAAEALLDTLAAKAPRSEAAVIRRLRRHLVNRRDKLRRKAAAAWQRLAALDPFWTSDLPVIAL